MIRFERHPGGLRLMIFGRHVHHGLIGLVLLLHDRADWRAWIVDAIRHPKRRR